MTERKSQNEMDDTHSDSSVNQRQSRRTRFARQRSMPNDYSTIAVKSPQTEEPVNTIVIIPPVPSTSPPPQSQLHEEPKDEKEEQEPSSTHSEVYDSDEID